jgi:hypothetical protein
VATFRSSRNSYTSATAREARSQERLCRRSHPGPCVEMRPAQGMQYSVNGVARKRQPVVSRTLLPGGDSRLLVYAADPVCPLAGFKPPAAEACVIPCKMRAEKVDTLRSCVVRKPAAHEAGMESLPHGI